MAGFSAEWLALREPADHASRSVAVTRAVVDALPRHPPLRVLDLAAGTGSNLRYLMAAGSERTRPTLALDGSRPALWLLVDHDPALLSQVPTLPGLETRCMDLATLGDPGIFDGRALVTASALLDLASEGWLRTLADRCADVGAAVLFALTYDGRIECSPPDPDDDRIRALVNRHQRIDKGFGPALGPAATDCAARCFASLGYDVRRAHSDWRLPPESRELQQLLIDGWAQAATQVAPSEAAVVAAWRRRRLAHVAVNLSHLIVGHEDLAAWKSEDRRT